MSAAAGSKKPSPPPPLLPPPPPGPGSSPVKCPRCDSPNTKFCYYNNYSLSQPRHFCKTCRRYWTKGGALRNVPVGGGCRKSKKSSKSSASTTTLASSNTTTAGSTNYLQLGVGGNQFVGFNYPTVVGDTMYGTIGGGGNITMSIESLSSMNQDLHWKLQQQRLAMLFGGATATATATATGANSTMMSMVENVHHQVADPISFHHLQVPVMEVGPNGEICGPTQRVLHHHSTSDVATTWFLESSTSSSAIAPSGGNAASSVGNEWNGMIPNWSDMQQFNALP